MFDMFKNVDLKPNEFVVVHNFYFSKIGYYFFRIVVESGLSKPPISTHTEEITMNILDAPCYPPTVSIKMLFLFIFQKRIFP